MTVDSMDLHLNGPRDRAETSLGFIAMKAAALREGLLARTDPTVRASLQEEQEALRIMLSLLESLLESPVYVQQPKSKKSKKPKETK